MTHTDDGPIGFDVRFGRPAEPAFDDAADAERQFARRETAKGALRIALAIAAADGPLPIGDVIAIGILVGAGTYLWLTA